MRRTRRSAERDRTRPILTADAHGQKIQPAADWPRATGASDRPISDLKGKGKALPPSRMATGQPQFEAYFSVQTFMDFMPVSASVLVSNVPLSTTVVVVAVGFLSTTVHFL